MRIPRSLEVLKLGTVNYLDALKLQEKLVSDRKIRKIPDTLLSLQHPPTYTLGKRRTDHNLLIPESELKKIGAELHYTQRGGDITYHGPHQAILYPIISLRDIGCGARNYVEKLELTMIELASLYGVKACPGQKFETGVWVGERKIGAIGVRITYGITSHGLAFNIDPDLEYFKHIVPCGIADKEVTSLRRETGRKFDERFLVEETNRHIGWSIVRNRSLLSLDIEGDQSHDDSKSMVTGKIKALSHKDKKKGENHSIQEESSQVSKEENGKKADAGNKSNMPTDFEEDESSCEVAVDSINTLTSSYSRPEKDLPIKKRKEYYLLVTETASVEAEDTTNMHEEEDLQEDGCKRTKDMSCPVNLECATLKNDSMQVQEILEEMVPEKTAVEPKERRRSGRNRKSLYFSCSEKYLIKYNFIEENLRRKWQPSNRNKRREQMQMPEAGMPEKVEYEKKKKKRGRPKMVNDQSQFEIVLGLPANFERCRSKVRRATKA